MISATVAAHAPVCSWEPEPRRQLPTFRMYNESDDDNSSSSNTALPLSSTSVAWCRAGHFQGPVRGKSISVCLSPVSYPGIPAGHGGIPRGRTCYEPWPSTTQASDGAASAGSRNSRCDGVSRSLSVK